MTKELKFATRPNQTVYDRDVDANFDRLTHWSGYYQAGRVYEAHEEVVDNGWLAECIRRTTTRPAPQPSEAPSYDLPDAPAFVEQQFSGVCWTGHLYEFSVPVRLRKLEAWVPELTPDTNYRFLLGDLTDPNNEIWTTIEEPVLVEDQWTTISAPQSIIRSGRKFAAIIDALNSGSDTTVTGGWARAANSNQVTTDPGTGAWGTRNNATSLRINKTDADTVDRSTELLGIVAGSTVTFVETVDPTKSVTYQIETAPTDQGTHVSWGVNQSAQGPGGLPDVGDTCTMTATVPVPSPTRYVDVVGGWGGGANFPSWATVTGLKRLGGVDQPAPDDQFGIRLECEPLSVSPDWDLKAYSRELTTGATSIGS